MRAHNISRGAQKCLGLLRWYAVRFQAIFPYQETMAGRLGIGERQLRRYLNELVKAGFLSVAKGGQGPATYALQQAVENKPHAEENVRSMSGLMSGLCPVWPDLSLYEFKKALGKAKASTPARLKPIELPPPTVTNEYGRVDPNPEFRRINGILTNAQDRIRRARNPAAYERAILQAELAGRERTAGHGVHGDRATGAGVPQHETPCSPLAEPIETSVSVSGEVAIGDGDPPKVGVRDGRDIEGRAASGPASLTASRPDQVRILRPKSTETPRKPPDSEWVTPNYLQASIGALALAKSISGRSDGRS